MQNIGKKCSNLLKLEKLMVNVPNFILLTKEELNKFSGNWTKEEKEFLKYLVESKFNAKYRASIPKKFSVRSSGSISAPGRMDSVLNVTEDSLTNAVNIVLSSIKSDKLHKYLDLKKVENFSYSIIIQEMVQGDATSNSCSGVLLTENPFDVNVGGIYVEFLPKSNGTELMSGKRTPETNLQDFNPHGFNSLIKQINKVSKLFSGNMEVEFVIEGKVAYILQVREYSNVSSSISIINTDGLEMIGQGKTVMKLSCSGTVTNDKTNPSKDKILVLPDTDWEDTELLLNFGGVVTLNGGRLSHAASISREFSIPCVVGTSFKETPKEGDKICFDTNGTIFKL